MHFPYFLSKHIYENYYTMLLYPRGIGRVVGPMVWFNEGLVFHFSLVIVRFSRKTTKTKEKNAVNLSFNPLFKERKLHQIIVLFRDGMECRAKDHSCLQNVLDLMQKGISLLFLFWTVLQNYNHKASAYIGCSASPCIRRHIDLSSELAAFWRTSLWSNSWLCFW